MSSLKYSKQTASQVPQSLHLSRASGTLAETSNSTNLQKLVSQPHFTVNSVGPQLTRDTRSTGVLNLNTSGAQNSQRKSYSNTSQLNLNKQLPASDPTKNNYSSTRSGHNDRPKTSASTGNAKATSNDPKAVTLSSGDRVRQGVSPANLKLTSN